MHVPRQLDWVGGSADYSRHWIEYGNIQHAMKAHDIRLCDVIDSHMVVISGVVPLEW